MRPIYDAKRRLKGVTKRTLARMGFFVGRYPQTYTLDAHLLQLSTRLAINCVLDVGAHHGEFVEKLRDAGYRGRIVSFEPVHESFAVLEREHGRDPNWAGYEMALGDHDGEATLNILKESVFNSLLSPNPYGVDRFATKMRLENRRSVPMRTLDSIWAESVRGIDEPRVLLKLDTQGYDLVVLQGAMAHLGQIDALQLELAVQPIYNGISNELSAAIIALRDLGFLLAGLYPVSWDPKDELTAVEVDGLFWRNRGQSQLGD